MQKDCTSKQSTSPSNTQGKKKGRLNALDVYIIFCLVFAVAFTVVEEVRLWLTGGQEASQLAQGVFMMATGELFAAVFIYRFKIKKKKEEETDV